MQGFSLSRQDFFYQARFLVFCCCCFVCFIWLLDKALLVKAVALILQCPWFNLLDTTITGWNTMSVPEVSN